MVTESNVYDNSIQWSEDQSREFLMPNATRQARGTSGATQERSLFLVACTRLFGKVSPCYVKPSPDCAPSHTYRITSVAWKRTVGGNREAQGGGGLQVDDEPELRGLLYR